MPTAKQILFAAEYAADRNGVRAYFRAYGRCRADGTPRSYKAAQVSASRLLSNPIIRAEAKAAGRAARRRCRVSADRVLRELAAVAFFDPLDAFAAGPADGDLPTPRPLADMNPVARRAVAAVRVRRRTTGTGDDAREFLEVEYRFADKIAALDKLCRHLGLFGPESAVARLLAMVPQVSPEPHPVSPVLVGGNADPGAV